MRKVLRARENYHSKVIENHNPAAARLFDLLTFINFEDIFIGLFDRDGVDVLAKVSTRATEPSEVTISSDGT